MVPCAILFGLVGTISKVSLLLIAQPEPIANQQNIPVCQNDYRSSAGIQKSANLTERIEMGRNVVGSSFL